MFEAIETKIITRLRERLGGAVHVGPERELSRVPDLRQRAPAAWVIYDGYGPGAEIPGAMPGVQQIVMDWYIVLVGQSARGNGDQDAARDQAAGLASKVLEALLGFDVGGGKRLRLAEAPGPEYDAGYCHLPLKFTCAATFKGSL